MRSWCPFAKLVVSAPVFCQSACLAVEWRSIVSRDWDEPLVLEKAAERLHVALVLSEYWQNQHFCSCYGFKSVFVAIDLHSILVAGPMFHPFLC